MTRADREALRRLVDARVRELVHWRPGDPYRCKECGAEMDACTDGCKTCWVRHRNRTRRRVDERWAAYERSRSAAAYRRRRAAAA